jgi:hypothetical protein
LGAYERKFWRELMSDDLITLIVLTNRELLDWKYFWNYRVDSWFGNHYARFINTKLTVRSFDINKYRQIQVGKDAKVIDVINEARKVASAFPSAPVSDWLKQQYPDFEFNIGYSLYCPAVSGEELDNSSRISDLGIGNFELVVLDAYNIEPSHLAPNYAISPVKNYIDFQRMVLSSVELKEKNPISDIYELGPHIAVDEYELGLYAILLYTDEDTILAQYVRDNFDELHKMSGPNLKIFVIESPPKDSAYAAPAYWKSQLEQMTYMAWSLLGFARSKPYDKAAVYDIAKSLGIFPDQIPCLAVFNTSDQLNKMIFPVTGDLTTFFRNTISIIQRSLSDINFHALKEQIEHDRMGHLPWQEIEKLKRKAQQEIFFRLHKSLEQMQSDKGTDRIIYNFFGQTVFINRPEGDIRLEDFHNKKSAKKESKNHE